MESTDAEVLLLQGLGEEGLYQVVNGVSGKILGEFEEPRGESAWFAGDWTEGSPEKNKRIVPYRYYLSRRNSKSFVWRKLTELRGQGDWGIEEKTGEPPWHEANPKGWANPWFPASPLFLNAIYKWH